MELNLHTNRIQLIETAEELEKALSALRQADEIAVDTESDSLFVYFTKTCLIQLTADKTNYVIDPFGIADFSALGEIMADPSILKIFHAAEYDIMCLKRDYGFEICNLFDTMVAARILGKPAIGLGALIEAEFGIHLDKKFQKADWNQRPLSMEMLEYGAGDTIYLSDLKNLLKKELEDVGLMDLAEEDFRRMCHTPAALPEPAPVNWWNVAGTQELWPSEIAALQKLCEFRDLCARRRDLPPFKIMPNQLLMDLAHTRPENETALRRVPGMSVNLMHRYGKDLLAVIASGKSSKRVQMPQLPVKPPNGILRRRERLKEWRKEKGIKWNVPSDVVLPKDIMQRIAEVGPVNETELRELMSEVPARYERFHKEILEVCMADE